jgi:hypothetical protein
MKKKYWIIAIFIIILIFIFINTFIHSFNENNQEYNFVITKTETTSSSTLIFYDKEKEISFWNFIISKNSGVKKGDLIYKPKHSNFIYVKRKDKSGIYKIFLKENYTGIFTFSKKD